MYDEGINALFANYNFNYNKNSYRRDDADDSEYMFLALNSGLSTGRWRLRNNSAQDKQSGSSSSWTNVSSRAETDIVPWRSRLVMGQASTNNSVFNSFQFRGVQLSSVDDMLPDSLRGYAPVVRGGGNQRPRNSPERLRHLQHQRRAGSFRITTSIRIPTTVTCRSP